MAINNNFNGTELVKTADKLCRLKVIGNDESLKLKSAVEDYIFEAGREKHKSPRIVCAGIYNSGKSTLLNALTGGNNFEVGDIPTTSAVEEVELNGYTYVDTPGLNANNMDNETAQRAFKDADVIVFVSNIMSGGLKSDEAEYLKKLVDILGGTDNLKSQTIFVMSNKDQVSEDEAEKIAAEHSRNIEKTVGYKPEEIFIYDAVTYETGVKEVSDVLINHSGINELKKLITEKANTVFGNMEKIRENRIAAKKSALEGVIRKILSAVDEKVNRLENSSKAKAIDKGAAESAIEECRKIVNNAKYFLRDKDIMIEQYAVSFYDLGVSMTTLYVSEEKSEWSAKRHIKEKLQPAYERRERALSKRFDSFYEYIDEMFNDGTFAVSLKNTFNHALVQCNDALKKCGIYISSEHLKSDNINVPVKVFDRGYLRGEFEDDVIRYDGYYSLDQYVSMYADINDMEYTDLTFFGREVTKTEYSCNGYEAADEMIKDMNETLMSNIKSILKEIFLPYANCYDELKSELDRRLELMIKEARSIVKQHSTDSNSDLKVLKDMQACLKKYLQ